MNGWMGLGSHCGDRVASVPRPALFSEDSARSVSSEFGHGERQHLPGDRRREP
jgi:hypothetical protein